MSKFFTSSSALLLACVGASLASEEMTPTSPKVDRTPSEAPAPAGPGLPAPLMAGRFSALGKKSPFTLASNPEENADFAKDLILAGYFRIDGKDFVIVANRTRPDRLMVGTDASPAAQGLILVKVERDASGDPAKLKAQIRKGTETAMLKYETATATPTPPAGQPASGQSAPPPFVPAQTPPTTPAMTPVHNIPGVTGQPPAPTNPLLKFPRRLPTPPPKVNQVPAR